MSKNFLIFAQMGTCNALWEEAICSKEGALFAGINYNCTQIDIKSALFLGLFAAKVDE